ncbi:hypothetical protein CVT25_002172 [Psilocybe cyanescens]|uniref:Uncharacterized protein n=1 Tax=Psilocybe cyanescens TaxID=93625 RepID=A0A409X038_PSICY|nr:hypothetical protein CVT25_002172 [Psilocybe cyanescens]
MVDTSGDVNSNGMPPPPQPEPAPPSTSDDTTNEARNNVPEPMPPLWTHRTHISEHVCNILRALLLSLKLSHNKKIEAKNLARVDKDTNHQIDPTNFPDPGSPQASVISLMEEDEANLRNPLIAHKLFDLMPQYIISWLAAEDARTKELKRKHDESLKDPVSVVEDRVAKRRCMQGAQLTLCDPLAPASLTLPQIMFDTKNLVAIPLSFFTQKNLCYIIDELASLPTKKVNSCSGDSKAMYILDIEKLSAKLGGELSMDFGSYLQAADEYFKFQLQRSADKEWGDIWSAHFRFFDAHSDTAELFPAWMHAEHKMCHDTQTYHQRYLISDYEAAYNHSVIEHKQHTSAQANISKLNVEMAQMCEHMARMSKSANSSPFSGFNSRRPAGAPSSSSALFPNGSKIGITTIQHLFMSLIPPICLFCAEIGHTLAGHPREKIPAKFPDGKNAWARLTNGRLISPDNREICIGFNLRGANTPCRHGATHLHICSLCGSKSHHALSSACRLRA